MGCMLFAHIVVMTIMIYLERRWRRWHKKLYMSTHLHQLSIDQTKKKKRMRYCALTVCLFCVFLPSWLAKSLTNSSEGRTRKKSTTLVCSSRMLHIQGGLVLCLLNDGKKYAPNDKDTRPYHHGTMPHLPNPFVRLNPIQIWKRLAESSNAISGVRNKNVFFNHQVNLVFLANPLLPIEKRVPDISAPPFQVLRSETSQLIVGANFTHSKWKSVRFSFAKYWKKTCGYVKVAKYKIPFSVIWSLVPVLLGLFAQ